MASSRSTESLSDGETPSIEEVDESNVIRLRVENVGELTEDGVYSETKRINGFPWWLSVSRRENDEGVDSLMANLFCEKSEESEVWACAVNGNFQLIHPEGEEYHITTKFRNTLWKSDYIEVALCSWEELEEEGFINDLGIDVLVRVSSDGISGGSPTFRSRRAVDFFSPSKISDIILLVDEAKLHVSRQILAHASPYFETLFYGDFSESNEKEIKITDVSADEFVTLLEVIYDTGTTVTDENVEFLLKLADRFNITRILDKAEEWLHKGTKLEFAKSFELADRYKLTALQIELMESMDKDKVKELSTSLPQLSEGIKDELIKRMMEM